LAKGGKQLTVLTVLAALLLFSALAHAGQVQKIGSDLYAYVSDNDASANATFLVGPDGILVVDTGLNPVEGQKLATAIHQVSPAPVKFIVNTHYQPDHQGGNRSFGPEAAIKSTAFTREQTLALLTKAPEPIRSGLRPADITSDRMMVYVGEYLAEVYFPGPAHTMGDLIVYFPKQQAVATGDLFLNRSCPAMDRGDARNWIRALDQLLDRPLRVAVPGHIEVGTREDLAKFRDYLTDLYSQVETL
jgi:cyclase